MRHKQTTKFRNKSLGQGMTEYLIVVALVSVAAVAVYRSLGTAISHKTASIAQAIAEQDNTASEIAAKTAASQAAQAAQNSGKVSNQSPINKS